MWIDSHCHLDFPDYTEGTTEVLTRAKAAGVTGCLTISTELAKFPAVRAIAEQHDNVWCSVGIHPHEAAKEVLDGPAALVAEAAHPKVIAFGETGLDFYYQHSPRAEQEASFRIHIAAARACQLPLIVHARDADDDTIRVLRDEYAKGAFPGLIHCFTSGPALAACALELGFMISFSGIATFKNAQGIRDVAASVPLSRILVETDAPYLAPVPHRGRRNEPAFVVHTGAEVARLKGVSIADLAQATTDNFFRLFSKASRPQAA